MQRVEIRLQESVKRPAWLSGGLCRKVWQDRYVKKHHARVRWAEYFRIRDGRD